MSIRPWERYPGPFKKIGDKYIIEQGTVKKITASPAGAPNAKELFCHLSGVGTPVFGQYYRVKYGNYWGLVTTDDANWKIVRLWELSIPAGYLTQFVGYPKKSESSPSSPAPYAAYTLGTTSQPSPLDQKLPLFYRYPTNRNDYYKILSTSEMEKFASAIKSGWSGSPGGSNPNPPNGGGNIPPTQGQLPSGPISSTGPNSSTPITVGTNPPSSGDAQDIAWWLNYPPAPSANPSPTDKPGDKDKGKGQWVTGPDGIRYYLPPGIDFAGLQREYDRTHPKPETKIVVRMPKAYASPVSTVGTKPRMTQRQLDLTESGQAIGTATETFVFPYIPQNIRYSDIGSQWQEIPRALNTSFVDWVGYKLMKVSMDFLVTARMQVGPVTTPNIISDGLFNSVADDLSMLRRMATNKSPVTLEGFDDILSVQMARSKSGQPKGIEFVIQDLNITAGRRTIDINTGLATSPISNIAAAQVSLTLQEIPIESVTIVKLPPLNLGTPLIGKKEGGGGGVPSLGLQSDLLTGLKWAVP